MEVVFNKKVVLRTSASNKNDLVSEITNVLRLPPNGYYLLTNGRAVSFVRDDCHKVEVVPRLPGGKGGFGSMLRAIGAQIEKTTNREACRDLSGRRLRDINEEQRLKNWIAQQAKREEEAALRKKKKLEKLCEEPKLEFKDEAYEKERSVLPEVVEDAVIQGLQASCSGTKRKPEDDNSRDKLNDKNGNAAKKKPKLWLDADIDSDISSSSDSEGDDREEKTSPSNIESSGCSSEVENKSLLESKSSSDSEKNDEEWENKSGQN